MALYRPSLFPVALACVLLSQTAEPASAALQTATFETKLLPTDGLPHHVAGTRVSIDGDRVAVVAKEGAFYGAVAVVYVYLRGTGGWVQEARLDGGTSAETLGGLDIDGDVVAFGANPFAGIAGWDLYERGSGGWGWIYGGGTGTCCSALGLGIAVEGQRCAVTNDLGGSENTQIYSSASGAWAAEQNMGPGGSVDLRDDLFVMSTNPAPYYSSPQIRVFQRVGTTWSLLATPLSLGGGVPQVAFDGDHTLAVGDPLDGQAGANAGAVYLFRRAGASWVLWEKLLSPEFPTSAGFGSTIALDGGTLAVGSAGNDGAGTNAGAVYLYRRNGGWTQTLELVAPDAAPADAFGSGVALQGERLIVGASGDDDLGSNRGSAYVFALASAAEVYCSAKVASIGCLPEIDFVGAASATSASPFLVSARQLINNKMGVAYYGLGGRASVPFQGGLRCVATPVKRTGAQSSAGNSSGADCSGFLTVDFNARIQSGVDPNLVPGVQVNAQFWYRDGGAASGTGLSDAIEFVIGA